MVKLDRLGWAAGISVRAYGLRIGLRATSADLLARAAERRPPGWRPANSAVVDQLYSLIAGAEAPPAGVRRYQLLYSGAGRLARTLDPDELLEALDDNLRLYVAALARR